MSYNTLKINGDGAGPDSKINVSVPKILDPANTATFPSGSTLIFDQAQGTWNPATVEGSATGETELAIFGQGESNDYTNSGFSLTAGSTLGLYDSNPYNTFSGSISFNYVPGTFWLESITLAPGAYDFHIQADLLYSSSGYIKYHLADETNTGLHAPAVSGDETSLTEIAPHIYSHILKTTSQITVHLKIDDILNASASQGTAISQRCFIMIRRA